MGTKSFLLNILKCVINLKLLSYVNHGHCIAFVFIIQITFRNSIHIMCACTPYRLENCDDNLRSNYLQAQYYLIIFLQINHSGQAVQLFFLILLPVLIDPCHRLLRRNLHSKSCFGLVPH